jgi:DnaJ-class molecular chaperone
MDTEPEPRTLFPFHLLARTRRFSLELRAQFPAPSQPDIEMDVLVSAATVFTGHEGNHTYHRQVQCPGCGGNGGHQGGSRVCSFCGGLGHARHLLSDVNRSYLHVASSTCQVCGGKGVHPLGACSQCRGRGFVLQEETLFFALPAGWHNLYKLRHSNMGHQRRVGGAVGGILLTFHYAFPERWRLAEGSGSDLVLRLQVPVEKYTRGFEERVTTLDGRHTTVSDWVTDHQAPSLQLSLSFYISAFCKLCVVVFCWLADRCAWTR